MNAQINQVMLCKSLPSLHSGCIQNSILIGGMTVIIELIRKLNVMEASSSISVHWNHIPSQGLEIENLILVGGKGTRDRSIIHVLDIYLTGPHADSLILDTGSAAHICNSITG